jgi:hypothetical protein
MTDAPPRVMRELPLYSSPSSARKPKPMCRTSVCRSAVRCECFFLFLTLSFGARPAPVDAQLRSDRRRCLLSRSHAPSPLLSFRLPPAPVSPRLPPFSRTCVLPTNRRIGLPALLRSGARAGVRLSSGCCGRLQFLTWSPGCRVELTRDVR